MILGALFSIPLWLTIPGYFALGLLWAALYLPRAVQRQAKGYAAWKRKTLEGKTLKEALSTPYKYSNDPLSPSHFLEWRGQRDFTERAILKGFMLDIAFWPLRILLFLVVDALQVILDKVVQCLEDFWNLVIVPFFQWLGRTLRSIWANLIVRPIKHLVRFLRYVWKQIIAPAYRWVYDRVIRVYQTIIQRANREAIADMEVLNRAQEDTK